MTGHNEVAMINRTYRELAKYLLDEGMKVVDSAEPNPEGATHYSWQNPSTGIEVDIPDLGDVELENELIAKVFRRLGLAGP
jgi:hypothetical protein